MPRPRCRCRLGCRFEGQYFKPRGIPMAQLEEVALSPEECETLRLADLLGLYHEEAAARMRVSRATFGRLLAVAHQKLADAILHAKALRLPARERGTAPAEEHPAPPSTGEESP